MTPSWVAAGPTLYSDYQLATTGAALPLGIQAGDMLFVLYAGRAGTPVIQFPPDWLQLPLRGGGLTWAMAWHRYVPGDAAPIVKASATHMTWCTVLAYRGVGTDPHTGFPYEGLVTSNPNGNLTLASGAASLLFPTVTPQGDGRLVIKLGFAWALDDDHTPTVNLTIKDTMVERGPLAQQMSQGDHLLRFSDVMDLPGSAGVPVSGNCVNTMYGNVGVRLATLGLALLPAS